MFGGFRQMGVATSLNPLRLVADIWQHRYLLGQLIMRDVLLRYRGAMFGVAWIFLSPLIMLAIFAFIFGQIFQARWPQQTSEVPYWLLLYAGLIPFNLFADTVSRAPSAVRSFPSYVKKIVFPVQVLPAVPLGAALVHGVFNFALLSAALAWTGAWQWGVLLLPLILLPALLLALGLAWFIAAWGVFIKDMSQVVPLMVQALLFMSPVFYPAEFVPAALRPLFALNPLGPVIEACRNVVAGVAAPWGAWWLALLASGLVLVLGFAFFSHSREEFADAL